MGVIMSTGYWLVGKETIEPEAKTAWASHSDQIVQHERAPLQCQGAGNARAARIVLLLGAPLPARILVDYAVFASGAELEIDGGGCDAL